MAPAKLWLRIFFVGYLVISALLVMTLATPVPYGDLTRLGRVSDSEFGWRLPPPKVDPALLQAAPVDQADILVIGDSFSMTHRWQSVLAKSGYKVATTFWGQYGESLCQDFDQWLDHTGFKGQLVIIESVERILNERMRNTETCKEMRKPFVAKAEPFIQPLETLPGFALNSGAQLTTGWTTWQNTRRARDSAGDTHSDYQTDARVVPDGCKMFSNRLCGKSLFFGDDEGNGELTLANLATMQAFTRAHSRRHILWMVIPNKTTVYLEPEHSKAFMDGFRGTTLGPDLFTWARDQRLKTMDFWFSNDSHMSMHGQLLLGELMLGEVRKILPTPSAKAP